MCKIFYLPMYLLVHTYKPYMLNWCKWVDFFFPTRWSVINFLCKIQVMATKWIWLQSCFVTDQTSYTVVWPPKKSPISNIKVTFLNFETKRLFQKNFQGCRQTQCWKCGSVLFLSDPSKTRGSMMDQHRRWDIFRICKSSKGYQKFKYNIA